MNDSGQLPAPKLDWNLHVRNRNRFTAEMLVPYANCYVAWSLDGTRIIAHHADALELDRLLDEQGLPTDGYVVSFVDPVEIGSQL